MSRLRAREEEEEEEGELSPEQQLKCNNDMLYACWCGSVSDVRVALRRGAHVNASVGGQTGLIYACRKLDWDVAVPLVTLLLSKGFSVRTFDDHGANALHAACWWSSAQVVQLLLDADPQVRTAVTS
jgi:ankyrin repeat protein